MGRKLSGTVKHKIQTAFAGNHTASEELCDRVDEVLAENDANVYLDLGMLIATAVDNTDAATMGFKVGDIVALVKDADQTLQTITTDAEFAVAPVIGDLIIAKRPL